jgi:hypothetical protein
VEWWLGRGEPFVRPAMRDKQRAVRYRTQRVITEIVRWR